MGPFLRFVTTVCDQRLYVKFWTYMAQPMQERKRRAGTSRARYHLSSGGGIQCTSMVD